MIENTKPEKKNFKEKFFKFVISPVVNYGIVAYLIIIGIIISATADTNIMFYLGIFDILVGIVSFIFYKRNVKALENSNILLNYIHVYKNIPNCLLLKYQKEDYENLKQYVLKEFECLLNNHDAIVYINIHPGTILSDYLSQNIETLDRNFFKKGFLIIDPNIDNNIALFKYAIKLNRNLNE